MQGHDVAGNEGLGECSHEGESEAMHVFLTYGQMRLHSVCSGRTTHGRAAGFQTALALSARIGATSLSAARLACETRRLFEAVSTRPRPEANLVESRQPAPAGVVSGGTPIYGLSGNWRFASPKKGCRRRRRLCHQRGRASPSSTALQAPKQRQCYRTN
jgi:hypothetical protein